MKNKHTVRGPLMLCSITFAFLLGCDKAEPVKDDCMSLRLALLDVLYEPELPDPVSLEVLEEGIDRLSSCSIEPIAFEADLASGTLHLWVGRRMMDAGDFNRAALFLEVARKRIGSNFFVAVELATARAILMDREWFEVNSAYLSDELGELGGVFISFSLGENEVVVEAADVYLTTQLLEEDPGIFFAIGTAVCRLASKTPTFSNANQDIFEPMLDLATFGKGVDALCVAVSSESPDWSLLFRLSHVKSVLLSAIEYNERRGNADHSWTDKYNAIIAAERGAIEEVRANEQPKSR